MQLIMPPIQFVNPKPANKDTKPGIMSINQDSYAKEKKHSLQLLHFFSPHMYFDKF